MALFKRKISLPMQVVIALVLGVVVGLLLYGQENVANYIKPFGDVFLNLIKMIVIPVVFCSLALSISNVGESKTVGRYGWKTILYFEIITTIAIGLGIIFGNLFKPGAGLYQQNYLKVIFLNINQLHMQQNNLHMEIILLIPLYILFRQTFLKL